jgi:N-acetyl sugar amidotransferase
MQPPHQLPSYRGFDAGAIPTRRTEANMTRFIRYCRRCVLPETKPDLSLDAGGVCSACRSYEARGDIDWNARERELRAVLEQYGPKHSSNYDCLIPVSGGKDSHYQTIKILELGLKPLCVTATTDKLSDIGRRNIENIKRLGVDYIEVTTNPLIRRRINRLALNQVGDISWPEHVTIFTIPVRLAVQLQIPLIVWGENSQNEYGGPAAAASNNALTGRWLQEFGGLLGLRVSDLVGQDGIESRDLLQYTYPSDADLAQVGVSGIFLGYYLPWDGYQNALVAQGYGFETYTKSVEGSIVNYENLDNVHTGIHDYFKFLKYGFGRASDLASLHVRRGRLSRETAIELVRMHDGKFPWVYLGYQLDDVLSDIDMSLEEFQRLCDTFTNRKLFVCDTDGRPVKDRHGNLTKINYDNTDDIAGDGRLRTGTVSLPEVA